MNERVIWTHPKGRFEVVERTYRALDGRLGRVRECRFTLRRDVRGLARVMWLLSQSALSRRFACRRKVCMVR